MKKEKMIRRSIVLCFVILFILVSILLVIVQREKNEITKNTNSIKMQDLENSVYDSSVSYNSIKELVEAYGCVFISETKEPTEIIYLSFGKKLYEDNGNSNQEYFESLVNACAKRLIKERFYLYDEEKSIQILVDCDLANGKISYKINDISNYFNQVDSKLYEELENTNIVEYQSIENTYNILYNLIENNMFLTTEFGKSEGTTEDGIYKYYLNQTVKVRVSAGRARNIVFLPGYEGDVFYNISVGTPLKEVAEKLPNYAFGSIEEGFLGYRANEVYVFFYEDEISVYGYSYYEHTEFEKYLGEYIQDRNLSQFVKNVTSLWQSYNEFEYDEVNKNLHLTYPSIGVMIDIVNNDPKGIVLYSNYYFTDLSKRYVAEGNITLNSEDDALFNNEINRRLNENN